MLNSYTDLKLDNAEGYYDISFGEDGDFELTNGLDTSLLTSFLTDVRADSSEVNNPRYRRGWWGSLFKSSPALPDLGSKIWLLDQSAITQNTINNAIAYAQTAYSWLVTLKYADQVNVSATSNLNSLSILVEVLKNNDVVSEQVFNLWTNTVEEIVRNG